MGYTRFFYCGLPNLIGWTANLLHYLFIWGVVQFIFLSPTMSIVGHALGRFYISGPKIPDGFLVLNILGQFFVLNQMEYVVLLIRKKHQCEHD